MKTYNLRRTFGNRATLTQIDGTIYKLNGSCEFIRVVRNELGGISSFEPEGCSPIKLGDIVHRDTEFRPGEQTYYILHTIDKLFESKNDYLVEINLKKASLEYVNNIIQNSTSSDRELNNYGSSVTEEDTVPRILLHRNRRVVGSEFFSDNLNENIWGNSNMWVSGQSTAITGLYTPPASEARVIETIEATSEERVGIQDSNPCGELILQEAIAEAPLPRQENISNFRVEFGAEGNACVAHRVTTPRPVTNIPCSG